jgi:hypothetical protein
MTDSGKLLFIVVRMVCHTVFFSGERGKDIIRLIR